MNFKISQTEKNRILEMYKIEKDSKPIISENQIDENIFNTISDKWRGLKGVSQGYGRGYFESMSRLRRIVQKLKKLDEPNQKVMTELENLKKEVDSKNMPQDKKDAVKGLIDNSLYHFNKYNDINDRILTQIGLLNLDSW